MRWGAWAGMVAVASGCFASNKPVQRLDAGEAMAGLSLRSAHVGAWVEGAGWTRLAVSDRVDLTAEISTGPHRDENSLVLGVALAARYHAPLAEEVDGWRLVLDLDQQLHWGASGIADDRYRRHWRTHLGALFVSGNEGTSGHIGGRFVAATGYAIVDQDLPWLETRDGAVVVGGAAVVGVEHVGPDATVGGTLELGGAASSDTGSGTLVLALYFGVPLR